MGPEIQGGSRAISHHGLQSDLKNVTYQRRRMSCELNNK